MAAGQRVIRAAAVARIDHIERLLGVLKLRGRREHRRAARIADGCAGARRRGDEPHHDERRERYEDTQEAVGPTHQRA